MSNSGVGGLSEVRRAAWLQAARTHFNEQVTVPNLVGLLGVALTLFCFFRLPEPWNVRLPCYLVVFVLTIIRPRVALYLMPLAVPWGSLDTIDVAQLHANSADILVAFLVAGWLLGFVLKPTYGRAGGSSDIAGPRDRVAARVPTYLLIALLALIGTMLLSMAGATSKGDSLKEVSKWVEFLILLLLGTQYLRTRRQIWIMILVVCLAGISQALYGYLQAAFNLGPEAFIRDTSLRVYGTFGQPNPYAGYLNIPLSITLALTTLGSNKTTRILAGIASVLLGIAEYLTLSRGGEVSLVVAAWIIVVVGIPGIRSVMGLLVTTALGAVGLFLTGLVPTYLFTPFLSKLGLTDISLTAPSVQDYSTAERLAHWIAGIRMFEAHPLLGVGIGNYPDVYSQYFVTIFVNSLGHAHNYYINIAAEMGVVGLTAYLFFLLALFVAGGRACRFVSRQCYVARAGVAGNAQLQSDRKRSSLRYDEGAGELDFVGMSRGKAALGVQEKRSLLLHPFKMVQYYRAQGSEAIRNRLTNDRALAIGLVAALVSVCVHNLVDDLYVHSLTNLLALLLLALIRLEEVIPLAGGNGGQF